MLDLIVFLAVAALLAVPLVTVHRASTMPAAGPAPGPRPREVTTRPVATLAPLEWPSDAAVAPTPTPMPLADGDRHASLRDRYVAARFPGIVSSIAELAEPVRVIRGARLLYEEGDSGRAQELLDLATAESPAEPLLPLAALEIAYLERDGARFVALADAFWKAHPMHPEWSEVIRLGHAVAPDHPRFQQAPAPSARVSYGPWPDTPNWIQASWDLTAEVLAAELHHVTRAGAPNPAPRQAAGGER